MELKFSFGWNLIWLLFEAVSQRQNHVFEREAYCVQAFVISVMSVAVRILVGII